MKKIIYIGLLGLLLIFLFFFKKKENVNFISTNDFEGYLKYPKSEWCEECKCKNMLYKDMIFIIDLDYPNLHSEDYEFLILREGYIYKGKFNEKIILQNVCFCLDDNLTKLNSLAFVLIDKTDKTVYKWDEKESYFLYKKEILKIQLKKNGSFEIR
jgi:hypothetical protein